ncbi:MAG: PilZ domain-containing protein [Pseudomonadota bacterium]
MANQNARRFQRVRIDLPATITINATDTYDGKLLNMSPGNLAVQVGAHAVEGDAAVVAIKNLDIIEGTVARTFPDGFAVSFLLSKKRRAALTEKLMLYANRDFSAGLNDRRATLRHDKGSVRTVCRLEDGTSLFVKIIDKSVDGVAVDAPRRPPIGSGIHIGRSQGVVIRHTPRGFVVVYDAQILADTRPVLKAV